MSFKRLQDNLRRILIARIQSREFTGASLASRVGLQQAHISNFLNKKRNLSLDAMDEVLKVLRLSTADLASTTFTASAVDRFADEPYDTVILTSSGIAATHAVIPRSKALDELQFKRSFLRRLRTDLVGSRTDWTRFVLIKADASNAAAMHPRISTGATLLLDRHYNSLTPYRRNIPNIYALLKRGDCSIRYATLQGSQLSLRPQSDVAPLDFLAIAPGRSFADYVIGRVCYIGLET
jgi:transcriptional regulator with XRE-family HTH domain